MGPFRVGLPLVAAAVAFASCAGPARTASTAPDASRDWLQFGRDAQHTGANADERRVTPANVSALKLLFRTAVPAIVPGAPVVLGGVHTPAGDRPILFASTKAGHLVAVDARTGAAIWTQLHAGESCLVNNVFVPCYTTSSPAIDPNRAYVYTYGVDGYVHKHAVAGGDEVTTGGWPELATTKPYDEKGSSALTFAVARNGVTYLYVANSGYPGDQGDYQGHLTTIDLADGTQRVFNALCSDQTTHLLERPSQPGCAWPQGGIWGRGAVLYEPGSDRIFAATGNGSFAPESHYWGDSVIALHADGTGAAGDPLDTYTPTNSTSLDTSDTDLGSSVPVLVPAAGVAGGGGAPRPMAVQVGKDSVLRVLALDDLSGQHGVGHSGGELKQVNLPHPGKLPTASSVWVDPSDRRAWLFAANANGLAAMSLSPSGDGTPELSVAWSDTVGATSPIVANGVLYCAAPHQIRALDPTTGKVLWQDTQIGDIRWQSPILVDGVLYIADESAHLTAYSVGGAPPSD